MDKQEMLDQMKKLYEDFITSYNMCMSMMDESESVDNPEEESMDSPGMDMGIPEDVKLDGPMGEDTGKMIAQAGQKYGGLGNMTIHITLGGG
jgi:hypothetical protein